MHSFLSFLFSLKVALCSCGPEVKRSGFTRMRSAYTVNKVGRLPNVVNESSGLAYRGMDSRTKQHLFWTLNDSGGRPTLYGVLESGVLVDSLPLPTLTNVDWEDLAQQDSTALFIADIGNNANNRPALTIYRVDPKNATATGRIQFRYARQSTPTAAFNQHNADSEALIYFRNRLYTFSKNRSLTNRYIKLYQMPVTPGDYTVTSQDSIYSKSMVTGGAISPDGQLFALVTYGKVLLFGITGDTLNFRKPLACLRIPRGQTEAISFVSPTDLIMSNEQGRLFLIRRKNRKITAFQ